MTSSAPESPPVPSPSDKLLTEEIRVNKVTDTTYHGIRHSEEFIPVGEFHHEPEQVTFEPKLTPLQRFAGRLGLTKSVETTFVRSLHPIVGPASDRVRRAVDQGKDYKAERIKREVNLYLRNALGTTRPPEVDETARQQYDEDTGRLNKQKTEYFGRQYKLPRSYRIAEKLRIVPRARPRLQKIADNLSIYDATTEYLDRGGDSSRRLTSPELERARFNHDRTAYRLELHRLIEKSGKPTLAPVPRGRKPELKVHGRRPTIQDVDKLMEATAKYNRTTLARIDEEFLAKEREVLSESAEREIDHDDLFTDPQNILELKLQIDETLAVNIEEALLNNATPEQINMMKSTISAQLVAQYFSDLKADVEANLEITPFIRQKVYAMLNMSYDQLAQLADEDSQPKHGIIETETEADTPPDMDEMELGLRYIAGQFRKDEPGIPFPRLSQERLAGLYQIRFKIDEEEASKLAMQTFSYLQGQDVISAEYIPEKGFEVEAAKLEEVLNEYLLTQSPAEEPKPEPGTTETKKSGSA